MIGRRAVCPSPSCEVAVGAVSTYPCHTLTSAFACCCCCCCGAALPPPPEPAPAPPPHPACSDFLGSPCIVILSDPTRHRQTSWADPHPASLPKKMEFSSSMVVGSDGARSYDHVFCYSTSPLLFCSPPVFCYSTSGPPLQNAVQEPAPQRGVLADSSSRGPVERLRGFSSDEEAREPRTQGRDGLARARFFEARVNVSLRPG